MGEDSKTRKLTRKEREYLARRNEILDTALKLFSQKGYHQTSMSEIAKESEFSIGSLYSFFKSKEDLFFNLFKRSIEDVEELVNGALARAKDARQKLELLVEVLFEYFEKKWEAFHIFALNRQSFDWTLKEDLGEIIRAKHLEFIGTLSQILEEGIKEGIFKPFRPEEMALAFIGLINGSIFLWIEKGRKYSLRERKDVILEIFYHGIEKFSGRNKK